MPTYLYKGASFSGPGVYVGDGHDIVYHAGHYYSVRGNRCYVASSHGGPWKAVKHRPAVLARVPPGHFHRHLPPGLEKKGKIPPGRMR